MARSTGPRAARAPAPGSRSSPPTAACPPAPCCGTTPSSAARSPQPCSTPSTPADVPPSSPRSPERRTVPASTCSRSTRTTRWSRGSCCGEEGLLRMSRAVVIGATGHIGSYLVPRLIRGGHEVIAVSRGTRSPYHASPEWSSVTTVVADREAQDAEGTFGARIAALRPDVVIDLICFTATSAQQLVDALRPSRPLLVHCGTIWVHGPALRVPVTEDEPRTAYGEYGTGKAEIEALLHSETRAGGVPAIVLHPGHISGPGWPVITPAGNLDPAVWTRLATGQPLALPDHGLGVLNHVHADDVAQAFELALARPAAAGASFHVVAAQAMTLRGLATGVARWFGREPVLEFVDWAEFGRRAGPEHAEATREHTFRGIAASIDRARQVLGYSPRFSSLEALFEALAWLVAEGQVNVGGQQFR